MPGMSGPELCEAVRALDGEGYCYFILLTSRSDKTDVALGLDRGADDFLTKPVDMTELRARLVAGKRILAMHGVVTDRNRTLAATLAKLEAAQGAIDRDLREARRLQQSLVPDRFIAFDGADVSLLLRPAGHIGGDLVGVFPVGDTRLCLYGIDVAGHGIASALMTARLAGHFAGQTPDRNVALVTSAGGEVTLRPPEDVCAILNRIVLADMGDSTNYFTLLVADVDLVTGQVRMAQAGHPAPVVLRADGRAEFVGDGGLPVGLIAGATYAAVEVTLDPGDRLLIHSDGITESTDPEGRMLDDDGLTGILHRNAALYGPRMLEATGHGPVCPRRRERICRRCLGSAARTLRVACQGPMTGSAGRRCCPPPGRQSRSVPRRRCDRLRWERRGEGLDVPGRRGTVFRPRDRTPACR